METDLVHGKSRKSRGIKTVVKTIFANNNCFCQDSFHHDKNCFYTIWQKLANPGVVVAIETTGGASVAG